ncbi:phosphatase PAP2 family protein [Rhodococcus sp. PvR099]|uniref:phosphatase PAP2 family protein n=1 Tax=Rhodococcus sp. PvR099 TaxID=2806602 RepID=UPI001AEA14B7|nr:phosphatase PAP2 family protein [Rhodococcus sp. PvR099]MBP1160493.1 undecaprenyl-diphosphatase [Rhodococcus sp. PvR099]
MPIDQTVLDFMVGIRTPWLTDVVTAITNLGGTVASWVITSVIVLALLARRHRPEALLVGGAMFTGQLVMSLLKLAFGRERPPEPARLVVELTHSFPSGHAMMSSILVCVVAAVIVRIGGPRWNTPIVFVGLGLWTLAVGLSRVYLGAHWLTDVIAGWLFGAAWAGLWIWAIVKSSRNSANGAPSSLR